MTTTAIDGHTDTAAPDALLAQVRASFAETPDQRARVIFDALARHAHAFLREVAPTLEEWAAGVEFLTRVGQTCSDTRQEFVLLSDVLGLSMLVETINDADIDSVTDSTVLGPFHMTASPARQLGESTDLTGVGEPCVITGSVRAPDGTPLAGAILDVWQCDGVGFYDVQKPDDVPAGNGRGLFRTDEQGRFNFRAVVPSHYPIPTDGPVGDLLAAARRHPYRPAHVHFIASAPGFRDLTTHVFVADSPYLDSDAVFAVKDSLVIRFETSHDRDLAAAHRLEVPFILAHVELVLAPLDATGAGLAVPAEGTWR
jgi:hydroxyquinol 1,2-dioxygenase